MQPGTFEHYKNGDPIPQPNGEPDGKLFDKDGNTIRDIPTNRGGWMAKIDARGSEEVTIKRGTLWFAGIVVAVVPSILSILATIIIFALTGAFSWVREDQSQKGQISVMEMNLNETRTDVKSLNNKFDKLQEQLNAQAIATAKKEGYELKAAEGDHGKK